MLQDPEHLLHQIELKQKQLYNQKLMQGQADSSDKNNEKCTQKTQSKPSISQRPQQFHQEEQVHSDDNSIQKSIQDSQRSIRDSQYGPVLQQGQESSKYNVQFYELPKTDIKRKKYGNMIVLYQANKLFLSLGPNYVFFFLAYLCFTFATIYLVELVNSAMQNTYFKVFNFIFCWLQNLSYLLVALSNPGIQLPKTDLTITQDDLKQDKFCKKCGAVQQRKTYHCRQCDVCIKDYDHHCPWTSKCIGEGNLKRFHLFICMTPLYIFYYMVIFMICMANLTVNHSKNLKSQPATF